MADELIRVTGIDDVCKFFDELPALVCRAAMAKALRAGITVVEEAVRADTPVADGDLAEHLTTEVAVDDKGRGGIAKCGFGKEGHKALWVEYGHREVSHKPDKRDIGQVPPHPFMRPAAEASADGAIAAFSESLASDVNAGLGGRKG